MNNTDTPKAAESGWELDYNNAIKTIDECHSMMLAASESARSLDEIRKVVEANNDLLPTGNEHTSLAVLLEEFFRQVREGRFNAPNA